ncbi:MAG: hypothetical protein K8R41_11835 [Bacteroidales bacterium]|nr:hypothetical protein [Bacteroidales bacterium]
MTEIDWTFDTEEDDPNDKNNKTEIKQEKNIKHKSKSKKRDNVKVKKIISNISFIPTKEPKILKLVQPYELANSEGPILRVYFEENGGYEDVYLKAVIKDSGDYLFVKVDYLKLIEYLNNKIALQEVILSCNKSYFIYKLNFKNTFIEMPIAMLNNFRLTFAENRISDLSTNMFDVDIVQTLKDKFAEWIQAGSFREENRVKDEQKEKEISIDASIYF